ncbi:ABC transporter ATP-binding protein [Rhizobium leguminosarum bv. trifolii CB782]|nr:ABC transporter ATP-binding protein [Rhizobium leguminosarum bv. trifolii CB782]
MLQANSDIAIRVKGVTKSFPMFGSRVKRLAHYALSGSVGAPEQFIALDDVSFEVHKGSTFGVMGRNGSGKSTLLQVIAGILRPNAGNVEVKGRVAALLELGSGFNPEFTGLENIRLNAALLGLSKKEIDSKLQAILDFADIGEHVYDPVKTYSSGMMVRLAFAVQVAIDPDILIVDEALAVGDAAFQLKCFRRIELLKSQGTTILFVSHSTEQIRSACDKALVLEAGRIIFQGDVRSATVKYLETIFPEEHAGAFHEVPHEYSSLEKTPILDENGDIVIADISQFATKTFGLGGASLTHLRISGVDPQGALIGGTKISVVADFQWDREAALRFVEKDGIDPNITLGITLATAKGIYIFGMNGFDKDLPIDCRTSDRATFKFEFEMPSLADGEYHLSVAIALGDLARHVQLRWYDAFLPLRSHSTSAVTGLFGIDWQIDFV